MTIITRPDYNLTKHFRLHEMCVTTHMNLPNTPNDQTVKNLLSLAIVLENCRELLGNKPIYITSAYRSNLINGVVGGAKNSAHRYGLAADFKVRDMTPAQVFRLLKNAHEAGKLSYDQLISYPAHTHISIGEKMRGQAW